MSVVHPLAGETVLLPLFRQVETFLSAACLNVRLTRCVAGWFIDWLDWLIDDFLLAFDSFLFLILPSF